jgi:hypothetical protein
MDGAVRRAQQDSMMIQELHELIERAVTQPGIRKREEMKLLGWMMDQQDHQAARPQQGSMTVQELNELIQGWVAERGLREHKKRNLLGWMLEYQAA